MLVKDQAKMAIFGQNFRIFGPREQCNIFPMECLHSVLSSYIHMSECTYKEVANFLKLFENMVRTS